MNNLPTWQKPIAWALIVLALPFVCLWRAYRNARRVVLVAKYYFPHGRN